MCNVSIIIRCYNEEAHIGRLLSGIMLQTESDVEIIIVDSGSTDATVSIASQYPTTIVTINKHEFSFGRSLNLGCEVANGDLLVFASAHVYPLYRNWLQELLKPFKDDRIACTYGRQCGNRNTKFSEHQVFARWFPEKSDPNQDHPFCNNANAAVRRSIWENLRYDETLTGLEDLAWVKKMISTGNRISYQSDAVVVHVHEETPRQVLNRYRREAIAMKAIFPHEKFSLWSFLHMFPKNVLADLRLALRQLVFWKNLCSIITFRFMQFWGAYRGFAQHGVVSKTLREKFYYPCEATPTTTSTFDQQNGGTLIDYSAHDSDDYRE